MIKQLQKVITEIQYEWSTKRILVIGDVMLDKYVWGEVSRISPEAPVPVVLAKHQSQQPGGAANVAVNLARLGAQACVIGFVGDDKDGVLLSECLLSDGISSQATVCADFPTITKLRILGGRQQMLRLDIERTDARPTVDGERLIASALAQLPHCDAVVLSDYAKGVLTPEVCQSVIQASRRLNIPVLVDPKCADFSRYRGATTICPNLAELARAANHDTRDLNQLLDAAEAIVSAFDLEFLTATLSEKGIAIVRPANRFIAPAEARQVFDVSGAGDTVIAVLALCLSCGLNPEVAAQLANVAAGIVVGKVGTAPIEKHELLAALASEIALHGDEKVISFPHLASRVAGWKRNGDRVVFTNGCFDLLHVGHITLLEQARRMGDRLIVAINSDASIRGLKGPNRPIVGEQQRARVLAALTAVDAVVVFSEPTPIKLILAVRPDVLVKGGDYNLNTVVGAKEVESWGGRLTIIPTVEGFSTTGLIEQGKR